MILTPLPNYTKYGKLFPGLQKYRAEKTPIQSERQANENKKETSLYRHLSTREHVLYNVLLNSTEHDPIVCNLVGVGSHEFRQWHLNDVSVFRFCSVRQRRWVFCYFISKTLPWACSGWVLSGAMGSVEGQNL
jgi:hypothetical protein